MSGEDRFNFLTSLIGYLIHKGDVTVDEAARHFEISTTELRDAITTLVVTATQRANGFEDTYYNVDPDALENEGIITLTQRDGVEDAPRLSTRQASAIAAGLSYLSTLPEFAAETEITELLEIITKGTNVEAPRIVEYRPGTVANDASIIRRAMLNQHRIRCEYLNRKQELTTREIDPIRLDPHGDVWYLRGYCLTNNELRNFRLDHMRSTQELDIKISDEAMSVQEIEDAEYVANESDTDVLIEVEPEAYSLISEFAAEVLENTTRGLRASIKVGYLPHLGRLIASYGGKARVIAPPEARAVVSRYALAALGRPIEIKAD